MKLGGGHVGRRARGGRVPVATGDSVSATPQWSILQQNPPSLCTLFPPLPSAFLVQPPFRESLHPVSLTREKLFLVINHRAWDVSNLNRHTLKVNKHAFG